MEKFDIIIIIAIAVGILGIGLCPLLGLDKISLYFLALAFVSCGVFVIKESL